MTREWTSPDDITAALQRLWDKGHLLVSPSAEPLFPLPLPLRGPTSLELSERYPMVQEWVSALFAGSRKERGFGYDLELKSIRHRILGPNEVPARAVVPTLEDALDLVGRRAESKRWHAVVETTRQQCPELLAWCNRYPLRVLQEADSWGKILAVVEWFRRHPLPGIYLRQVDLPGIDTKFIEGKTSLITALLDAVLPADHLQPEYIGVDQFAARFGLKTKPQLVQMRSLDPLLTFGGLRHVAASIDELHRWEPPALSAVIITENETNGLILPDHPGALTLFGLGYSIRVVEQCAWLERFPIHYWGDIDTHGFAMLSRLRGLFPHVTSMLMDDDTLQSHSQFWGEERAQVLDPLPNLTPAEQQVFDALAGQRHGAQVRLEQERIAFSRVERYFAQQLGGSPPSPSAPCARMP